MWPVSLTHVVWRCCRVPASFCVCVSQGCLQLGHLRCSHRGGQGRCEVPEQVWYVPVHPKDCVTLLSIFHALCSCRRGKLPRLALDCFCLRGWAASKRHIRKGTFLKVVTVVAAVAVVGVHAGFTYDVSFNDMTQVRSTVCCAHPSRCLVTVCCEGQVFSLRVRGRPYVVNIADQCGQRLPASCSADGADSWGPP